MSAPKAGSGVRVSGHTVEFTTRTTIAQTIARMEAAGEGFRTPLFRAAAQGRLAIATSLGGSPVLSRLLKQRRPTVVVLPDDHPDAIGPDAWPQAGKLLRWANAAIFHASGGRAEEYALIAEAAIRCGRLLLVECELRHLQAWSALAERELPRLNVLRIVPREGQHPIGGVPAGAVIQ